MSDTTTNTLAEVVNELGIKMDVVFVPWSRSRNAKRDPVMADRSLNWKVTLYRESPETPYKGVILNTDYTAGLAHCPSYKANARPTISYTNVITYETEHGKTARLLASDHILPGPAILPKLTDVVYSLVSDASVLDYPTYEEWAMDFGYDEDSRAGEAIYKTCLQTALQLRAHLGEANLTRLRNAIQDY
jgi:hypothetical protein